MLITAIAKYYDEIAKSTKPEKVLTEEIALISSLIKPGSTILDIGCGTGRHLIPLTKLGFSLTGIDLAAEHIAELRAKQKGTQASDLIQGDFLKQDFKNKKYAGIIVFWNSLNEICLNNDSLLLFLQKAAALIEENGLILINIDDIKYLNLSGLDFKHQHQLANGNIFNYHFQQLAYQPDKNITKTKEIVEISAHSKVIERAEGILTQRWWSFNEINDSCEKLGLKISLKQITANSELYLAISK
jgi:SAM-dependent methyltransferase